MQNKYPMSIPKNLLIFIFAFSGTSYGQNVCDLLVTVTKEQYLIDAFRIEKLDSVVVIYDQTHSFINCNVIKESGFEISQNPNHNYHTEYNSGQRPPQNLIIIYNYETSCRKHIIKFWRPFTGGAVSLTYKKKRGNFTLTDYSTGVF